MEERWIQPVISDMSGIPVGTPLEILFVAREVLPEIKDIVPGCNCTEATYDPETQILRARYIAEKIPKHLEVQGWFIAAKNVVVHYVDGSRDRLAFKIKVVEQDGFFI